MSPESQAEQRIRRPEAQAGGQVRAPALRCPSANNIELVWRCARRISDVRPCAKPLAPRPYDLSLLYDFWSVICMPLADRLNRNPSVCECSLITTPLSFLRYATEPPATTVAPAVTAE